jgi:hypothetical protein
MITYFTPVTPPKNLLVVGEIRLGVVALGAGLGVAHLAM